MIRIIIADDHPIVREGLKRIVENHFEGVVIDEVGTGEELLNKVWTNAYDLILLDISMPGRGGLEVLDIIKKKFPNLNVLVLSIHNEDEYALRVIRAGASGYLTKDKEPDELIGAMKKIMGGGKFISSSLAEKLLFGGGFLEQKPLHEYLSNREYQVLCLIASGKTISGIAKEMSLCISTVSTYRKRILEKMNMSNNAELTRYALLKGIVT